MLKTRLVRSLVLAPLAVLGCDADPHTKEIEPRSCERSEVSLARGQTVWTEVDSFDANGRRTRTVRTAVDNERAEDHAVDYHYDAAGRVSEEAHDEGANGTVDWTVAWTFDARGNWTLMTSTWPIWSKRHERVFDEAGELVSERVDDFTNGTWDLIATNTWEAGRLVERTEDTFTVPARKVLTYSYDDAGRLVQVASDLGADGVIDSLVTRSYDAAGRVSVVATRSPDGTWIEGVTLERDGAGVVVTAVWDSTLDGLEQYAYVTDDDGHVLSQEVSYGRDGAAAATRLTWTSGCEEQADWE